MKSVLIIKPDSVTREEALLRAREVVQIEPNEIQLKWISNRSSSLALEGGKEKACHSFATGNIEFDNIFIAKEFPQIWDTDFTAAWLDRLVTHNLGSAGALFLEVASIANQKARSRICADSTTLLARGLRAVAVEGGVSIRRAEGGETPVRNSVYDCMWDKFGEFDQRYRNIYSNRQNSHMIGRGDSARAFIYSLYGAWQKAFFVKRALKDKGQTGGLNVLDMGGGYGFLGAELAAKGHFVTVAEPDWQQVSNVGEWIRKTCGLEATLRFVRRRIEEVDRFNERFDIICFFESLLYSDRERVEDVLVASIERLSAGGFLLIRELPKEIAENESTDYKFQFSSGSLRRILDEIGLKWELFNLFTGARIDWEAAAKSVMAIKVWR